MHRRASNGFSLLEILIALAISSIALAGSYQIYLAALKGDERNQRFLALETLVSSFYDVIRKDLSKSRIAVLTPGEEKVYQIDQYDADENMTPILYTWECHPPQARARNWSAGQLTEAMDRMKAICPDIACPDGMLPAIERQAGGSTIFFPNPNSNVSFDPLAAAYCIETHLDRPTEMFKVVVLGIDPNQQLMAYSRTLYVDEKSAYYGTEDVKPLK